MSCEAWLGVEERVDAGHHDQLPLVQPAGAFGVAEPAAALGDVHPGRAGRGDLSERRVRDVVADLVADRELRPAVDLDVLDDALVLGRQELRERVAVLVHVVVGVERRVRQLAVRDLDVLGVGHGVPPRLVKPWNVSFIRSSGPEGAAERGHDLVVVGGGLVRDQLCQLHRPVELPFPAALLDRDPGVS